jgi:hypothetical protein
MVRPERFELPTCCSGGNRSIQLSYGRAPMSTVYMGRGKGFNLYLGMRWIESAFVRRKKELRLQNPGLGAF